MELHVRNPKSGNVAVYRLADARGMAPEEAKERGGFMPFPVIHSEMSWTSVAGDGGRPQPIQAGDKVAAKQLLAAGTTTVFFQANVHVFTVFVLLLGLAMGLGKAAVFKHIPTYFPNDVGAVGGLVGVIGGLGGFFCPILFGILLDATGIWTTCWMFLFVLSVACLAWMHFVVRGIMKKEAPALLHRIEHPESAPATA